MGCELYLFISFVSSKSGVSLKKTEKKRFGVHEMRLGVDYQDFEEN